SGRSGKAASAARAHARGVRGARATHRGRAAVAGRRAVQAQLPFTLSAPPTLAGMALADVRLLDWGGHPAALVTYGQGLGGLAVVERQADKAGATGAAAGAPSPAPPPGHQGSPTLPTISINGAPGHEL